MLLPTLSQCRRVQLDCPRARRLPSSSSPPKSLRRLTRLPVRRLEMVQTQIKAHGVSDPRDPAAMRMVPRHLFVDQRWWDLAYADTPLPIGHGQTISQPYTRGVA